MGINTFALWKSFRTHPANMGIASGAHNMITSLAAFDWDFTTRAAFHVIFLDPFLEKRVTAVPLRAIEPVMSFSVAVRAYSR